LLDVRQRAEIEARAPEINFLDLAAEPDFTPRFVEATRFPEITHSDPEAQILDCP
jgi:uncharacterized 2Fe-2S/4Fe-4S cluster protein (DUF4445 family)